LKTSALAHAADHCTTHTERKQLKRLLLMLSVALGIATSVGAQELEPGLYVNAPIGSNSIVANYGFSTGNVLLDASLPIEGAHAKIHVIGLGYLRTLDFFGRAAKLDVQLPVSWGHFEGVVAGEFRTRSPAGLADPRVRFAVNLFGSPALRPQEFANYAQRTIVGVSLQVALPLGAYDEERYVNVGANRWSFRPEVALSHRRNRWLFEVATGAWLFTENDDYVGHVSLTQRPLYFVKGNAIYTFRRNLWLSASYGHGGGGATTVGGLFRNNLQRNERIGIGLSLPSGRSTSVKIVFTSGLATRLGGDFDSIGVAYQYAWR
jgi:outer membrane putative beta-barrel porin/alpha-amylase